MPRYDSKQWDRDAILRRVSTEIRPDLNKPEPGTYRIRKAKGGVYVPVLIYRPCACTVNGPDEHFWIESCDRYSRELLALLDGWEVVPAIEVWNYCRPIKREDYDHLVATHSWARSYAPDHPDANPKRRIDLTKMPPIF